MTDTKGMQRLRTLEHYLRHVLPERIRKSQDTATPIQFDIEQWRSNCGTAGCAIGWALQDQIFDTSDFHMELVRTSWANAKRHVPVYRVWEPEKARIGEYESFEAICEFFGITARVARLLFSEYLPLILAREAKAGEECFLSPIDVANRIASFIRSVEEKTDYKWAQEFDHESEA